LVADRKGNIIINEPSVVAVDVKSKRVLATGSEAKKMIGRTPGSIVPVMPIRAGVIADFDMTADMLHDFIFRAGKRSMVTKTRVVISVPSGVTEVERRAVREAAMNAGAKQVMVMEEPMAAAIGAGLPIEEPTGNMVVDIGGGTSEVAVISLGGIVAARSIRVGGDEFDSAIIAYIKRKYNLLIGERTAEQIKINIGSAYPLEDETTMEIKGRNLVDGLPKNVSISSEEIREALCESVALVIDAIKETLERTPPELAADIIDRGITLTGGGAMLRGLDRLIQKETGIDVHIAENPLDCVAAGTGSVLENLELLREVVADAERKV
jgi:rod shape-determining protein MreB